MKRKILVSMTIMFWIVSAVIFIKIPNVSAGAGYDWTYGEDYWWSSGDVSYASAYANGIFLSEGSGYGAAAWDLIITPSHPCSYNLEIGAYYSDESWFGDGPELFLYNWTIDDWDSIANPMPKGTDQNPRYSLDITHYVSPTGYVYVEIYAEGDDATDVNYVEAIWEIDDVPPSNPNDYYSDHLLNTWSNDNTIYIEWSGAVDDRTSVSYSYEWSTSGTTIPDTVVDTTDTSTTSSPLPDSSNWYFHVRAVDACGNWNSNAYHVGPFKIDATAPEAPNPDDGVTGWSTDRTPTFSWSAPTDLSGVIGYSYAIDTQPDNTIDIIAASVTLSNQPEGTHTFYVKAKDNTGNWGLSGSHVFKIDETPPYLSITSPSSDSIVTSSNVTISWSGSDSISIIDHYEIKLNQESYLNVGLDTTYTFAGVSDGNHSSTVKAIDKAGNYRESTVTFGVDIAEPSVSITNPSIGAWSTTTSVEATWSGNDVTSGIDYYEIRLDDGNWVNKGTTVAHTFIDIVDGAHTISIRAYDKAGNFKETAVNFGVDTIEPIISINSPSSGITITSPSINVSWSCSDVTSNVDHYEVRIDGGAYLNIGLETNYTFTGVTDGSHTIIIKAIDKAGNIEETTINIQVDTNLFSVTGPYGGLPLYLSILAVIIVAIFILWFVLRKKKATGKEPTSKEEVEKPSEPSQKEGH